MLFPLFPKTINENIHKDSVIFPSCAPAKTARKKKGLTIFSGEKYGILKKRDERECLAYSDDNKNSNSKYWQK